MRQTLLTIARVVFPCVAFFVASCCPAQAQKRVALVIGVAAYKELPALNNPVSDAHAIATLLGTHGIATTVLPNPTHAQMLVALARFRRLAEDADLALVYYAGHGLNLAGADVLLPSDTPARCDPKTREEALAGTVGIDEVIAASRPARNRVVILDACRTAAFPSCPSRGDATLTFRALGRVAEEHRGTLIATSAATGGVASDGPRGGHSPYNALLRQHLAGKPQSFLHEVLFDVNRELGSRPSGQQPSLHFAHGVPPAVCLKVEGCGQSAEDIELARLRAKIEELQRAQTALARKQAALQVPAPEPAVPSKEAVGEVARNKAAEEKRQRELREAEEAKRAEALRKAQADAEKAKAQREAEQRTAAEKKAADARQKAAEAAKAKKESERTTVAALPKAEKQTVQGNFDGRWRSSIFTMHVAGNRPIKFYEAGRSLPLLNLSVSGNVATFSIRSKATSAHIFHFRANATYHFTLTFQNSGEIIGNFSRGSNQGALTNTIRFSRV